MKDMNTTAGSEAPPREHLTDIDRAKGLGIFLVVLGHLVTGRPPQDADWYMHLRTAIYAFHMPFFIYLSGFMFYYTRSHMTPWRKQPGLIARRAHRLLVPFAAFGLLIVIGKHVAAEFIHVDNMSPSMVGDLINLFLFTNMSAAKSVWYVFVLFEYTVVLIVLHRFVKSPLWLFLISVPMSYLPIWPILYLDRFSIYLPFFLAAGVAVQHRQQWTAYVDRFLWLNLALFTAAIVATRFTGNWHLSLLLCGFLSIPTLHGLCRRKFSERWGVLATLGGFSFVIYLLNTVAIGVAKGVGLLFLPWDGAGFLIFFPLLLGAGLIGPMIAKILIFRRVPYLDRLTN